MFSWFARLTFLWQLLLAFIVMGVLPLLAVMIWQQHLTERAYLTEKSQTLWFVANEKKRYLLQVAQSHKDSVQQSAQTPLVGYFLRQMNHLIADEKPSPTSITPIQELAHAFLTMYQHDAWLLVNAKGCVVLAVQDELMQNECLTDPFWQSTELGKIYHQAAKQTKTIRSGYQWHESKAQIAEFIASPVFDQLGSMQGVLIVQLNKHWLDQFVTNRQGLGETGEINLGFQSSNGQVHGLTIQRYPVSKDYRPQEQRPLEKAVFGKSGMGQSNDYRGEAVLSAWLYEPELNIGLVAKQDLSELMVPLEARRQAFFEQLLSVSIVLLLAILWGSRRLSLPISIISQQVKSLGSGIGYTPLQAELAVSKELGELVTGMNLTAQQLEDQLDMLSAQAAQLEEQAADLEYSNQNLEHVVSEKTAKLSEYIALVDQQIIISRTDLEGNIIYVSEAFCRISGHSKAELMGKNHRVVRHPDMPVSLYEEMWRTIRQGKVWRGEILNLRKDGSGYWVDATISPTFDANGVQTGYMAIRQDITERKRAEALSLIDDMTGLYNRRFFNDQIEKSWRMAARQQHLLAFIMIDVDFFKRYNDSQGHLAGDEALKAVAKVLQQSAKRSTEQAFRLGGEEMAIISLVENPQEALNMAEQVRAQVQSLQISHPDSDAHHLLTISVGLCFFDGRNCTQAIVPDVDALYQQADKALYQAKSLGRNQVVLCDQPATTDNRLASR